MSLSAAEKAAIRQRLLDEKAVLTRRIETIHDHAKNSLERDSAEQAAQLGNLEVVSALESGASATVAELDAALQRLDSGSYGSCVDCGGAIAKARLEARPSATQCLACAEREEAQ